MATPDIDSWGRLDPEARLELVKALRGEIGERVRHQHQVLLLSGAVAAAFATLVAGTGQPRIEPFVYIGICLLFVALALAHLNHDGLIVKAASFLATRPDDHGSAQRAWERHLTEDRTLSISALIFAVAPYAIPIFGAVAALLLYVRSGGSPWWATLPVAVMLITAQSGWRVFQGYHALANLQEADPEGRPRHPPSH